MDQYHWLLVNGVDLFFGCFCRIEDYDAKMAQIERDLSRIPATRLRAIAPVFFVKRLPGGRRRGGGFWTSTEAAGAWPNKSSVTGVPENLVQDEITRRSSIIAITEAAMNDQLYRFTILHEIAHSIHQHFRLVPVGTTIAELRGMKYVRNGVEVENVVEWAVEAYARYVIAPNRVCRDDRLPPGESMVQCSRRITGVLRHGRALAGM